MSPTVVVELNSVYVVCSIMLCCSMWKSRGCGEGAVGGVGRVGGGGSGEGGGESRGEGGG